MRFWLSRGCDGFRVDMADTLVKTDDAAKSGTSAVWRDIRAMLDHIEYVARKFGADHVAIGTDRSSTLSPMTTDLPEPEMMPIWEQFWTPPREPDIPVSDKQFRSIAWGNWPLFTVGLVQRGFSDGEIRKIIGGNVLRVAQETVN